MENEWSGLYYHTFNTYRTYQYTSLCKESTDILDFSPHSSHVTLWSESKIGNNLWKYIKIGAPFRISYGFLACNVLPNTLNTVDSSTTNNRISLDGLNGTKRSYHIAVDDEREPIQIITIRESEIKQYDINSMRKNLYLLFGKMNQDGIVEGLAACRFKSLLLEGSFKNIWNRESSFHVVLQHDRLKQKGKEINGLVSELTFDKPEDGNNCWVGTRLIYHFPKLEHTKFCAGGEAYYSISEGTGAASLGAKVIFQDVVRFMTTWNPFMGHVSGHCCIPAGKFLQFATRYDYNHYSYESDISIGLTLQEQKSSDETPNCRLGCRYTYGQGLAAQCMTRFTRNLSADLVISSNSGRSVPTIGLSFNFSA